MNDNYAQVKLLIKRFCFEKLKNNQGPVERFEELNKLNNSMIQNAQKLELLSAAVIYSYLREYGLNGKGGITTKVLAEYFNVNSNAITSKVFDVDCIVNRSAIFQEDESDLYEFIDIDRLKVSEKYYDFLESPDADDFKKSEKTLLKLIKEDPYFFDTYTVLHEYYLNNGKGTKAYNLMSKGYEKVMELILKNGKTPDILTWNYIENRHIIRLVFNFAALLWLNGDNRNAIDLYQTILKVDTSDRVGARYMIVAILSGVKSLYKFEDMFNDENGYLDWEKQEKWFTKESSKYKNEIKWWLDDYNNFDM